MNFYLALRNAAIRGQVVELGQTAPITDIKAIVFAEYCLGDECWIVDESVVETGSFDLRVRKGYTYTLGIGWQWEITYNMSRNLQAGSTECVVYSCWQQA